MLVILCVVFSWVSCIYGAAINAVQESVLNSAEFRILVPIAPLETCSLVIGIGNESQMINLVKELGDVEDRAVELEGLNVTCMLAGDEVAESYVDKAIGAKAIIVSRVSGGSLDRKMVLHFRHEASTYVLAPDLSSLVGCSGKEEDGKYLDSFDIFGEIHFLYEVYEGEAKTRSEDVVTTTEGGPVDPPEPPVMLIILIVCGVILLLLVAFCVCRCCCRFAPSYKSM